MKLKYAAAVLALTLLMLIMPGMTAFAGSDIDFSLDINTDISVYITGESIFAPVNVNTLSDSGYTAFSATLTYDRNAFSLGSSLVETGFKITENREGAKIEYTSPDGRASAWGVYCIPLDLVVKPKADGAYTIGLRVEKCVGADGKELAYSSAAPKTVNIYRTANDETKATTAKPTTQATTTTTTTIVPAAQTTSAPLFASDSVYDPYGASYGSAYGTPSYDEYSAYYDPYGYNGYQYPEEEFSASGSAAADEDTKAANVAVVSDSADNKKDFNIGTAAAIMAGLAVMFGAGFGVGRITRDDGID